MTTSGRSATVGGTSEIVAPYSFLRGRTPRVGMVVSGGGYGSSSAHSVLPVGRRVELRAELVGGEGGGRCDESVRRVRELLARRDEARNLVASSGRPDRRRPKRLCAHGA